MSDIFWKSQKTSSFLTDGSKLIWSKDSSISGFFFSIGYRTLWHANAKIVSQLSAFNSIAILNDLVHNLLIFIFFIIIQQLESRDNEISRLHKQLTGGRPVAALGRDCCYRGIDTLTEDMKLLQQQLIATKKELKESLEQQHEAKLRAIKLDEEKKKYAKDLKQMEEFALRFQDEANEKLLDKEKDYEHLVVRIRKNFFFFFLF